MKSKFIASMLLGALIMIGSCKKEDDAQTPKDFLTAKECWKLTKFELKDGAGNYNDVSTEFIGTYPCVIDNCYKFSVDGNFEQNEGATKCDPSDEQVFKNGTWKLSGDYKQLTWSVDGNTNTLDIVSLASVELIAAGPFNFGGLQYNVRLTFK